MTFINPWRRLAAFVDGRLVGRNTIKAGIRNSGWLFLDQIFRMGAGLLVGVWIARYLGPEQFGWLSYATATVGMIASIATLGASPIVVRELARSPEDQSDLLAGAFSLRVIGSSASYLACVGVALIQDAAPSSLVLIVAASLIFQVPDVADLLLQARGRARISATVRVIACTTASLAKVALILAEAPVAALAAAGVGELAVGAMGYWWSLRRVHPPVNPWRLRWAHVPALVRESWPLAVAGLAVSIQAYADQLFLGSVLGSEQLGQYSAALRLVAVFAIVPMVVQVVSAPEVARAKRDDEKLYQRRLYNLYRLMFGAFLTTGLVLAVAGPTVVRLLFGPAYQGAAVLVPWLALRLFFTNFGLARGVFLTNEGLLRFSLVTSVIGAVVNLVLNWVLVPRLGAHGAIFASYFSFGATLFIFDAFNARTRSNLLLIARATLTPWRPFSPRNV